MTNPKSSQRVTPRGIILALSIVAIAVGSLGYRLNRDAIDPAIDPYLVIVPETDPDPGPVGVYLENQGQGTAEIVAFDLALDGEPMPDWRAITQKLTEPSVQLFPNHQPDNLDPTGQTLNPGDRLALYTAPTEHLNVFSINLIRKLFTLRIGVTATYCDGEETCWTHCRNMSACESEVSNWVGR
jgi:hypothetical protein